MTDATTPVYGGTTAIADWIAAGRAHPSGTVTDWEEKRPSMVAQWRTDLNEGLHISQVPFKLSTVAFYWECEHGHRWRETPYLRNDGAGKIPKWKKVARSRSACRQCTIEAHAPRYSCGCPETRLDMVGAALSPGAVCNPCQGIVKHVWACGRSTYLDRSEMPSQASRCPQCETCMRRLAQNPQLDAKVRRMAVSGLPAGHEKVLFQCGVEHHPQFAQDLYGIVSGYGCKLCFKTQVTPGHLVEPGRVFRTRRDSATSATEMRLRNELAKEFRVAKPSDANAVRILGDHFGFKHVLPDILMPQLKIAIELDSPGRHGDWHRGEAAERDRCKDGKLAEVGWRVIRLRIDGLEAVDHADCIVANRLTKAAIQELIALIRRFSEPIPQDA